MQLWGKSISGRRRSKCKGLGVDTSFECWKSGKEAPEAGILGVIGGDVREINRPRSQDLSAVSAMMIKSLQGFERENEVHSPTEEYRERRIS